MKRLLAAASVLALMTGSAMAESPSSAADKPAQSGGDKMSPGTTGAMQAPTGGVATTPQEVEKQGGAATAPQPQGNSGAASKTTGGGDGEKPK